MVLREISGYRAGLAVALIGILAPVSVSGAEAPPYDISPEKPRLVFSPPDRVEIPEAMTLKARRNSQKRRLHVTRLTLDQSETFPAGVTLEVENGSSPMKRCESAKVKAQFDRQVLRRPGTYAGYFEVQEEKAGQWVPQTGEIEFSVTRPAATLNSLPEPPVLKLYRLCPHSFLPKFCGSTATSQLVTFGAPVLLDQPIPAKLSSAKDGLTDAQVTGSLAATSLRIGIPVDLTLNVTELRSAGKYDGTLLIDGEGLKEPFRLKVTVVVTDGALFLALTIALGVFVSHLCKPKEEEFKEEELLKQLRWLSLIGFLIAVATGMTAVNLLGQEYYGTLEHYLLAFVWGAATDRTVKTQRVREFLL